jgi:hypothetical protein
MSKHGWIKACTYGIMFMGTPHRGGNGVKAGLLAIDFMSPFMSTNVGVLENLLPFSEWLEEQKERFRPIMDQFQTKFAYEEYKSRTVMGHAIMVRLDQIGLPCMINLSSKVVPRSSAVMDGCEADAVCIHADHRDMVRFKSTANSGYKTVVEQIYNMVEEIRGLAPRWAEARFGNSTYLVHEQSSWYSGKLATNMKVREKEHLKSFSLSTLAYLASMSRSVSWVETLRLWRSRSTLNLATNEELSCSTEWERLVRLN